MRDGTHVRADLATYVVTVALGRTRSERWLEGSERTFARHAKDALAEVYEGGGGEVYDEGREKSRARQRGGAVDDDDEAGGGSRRCDLVVMAGEQLEGATNRRFRSCRHRVVDKQDDERSDERSDERRSDNFKSEAPRCRRRPVVRDALVFELRCFT